MTNDIFSMSHAYISLRLLKLTVFVCCVCGCMRAWEGVCQLCIHHQINQVIRFIKKSKGHDLKTFVIYRSASAGMESVLTPTFLLHDSSGLLLGVDCS